MSHSPQRIAVALYGAIGDVILSTPLLEALRNAFPAARITYIVGSTAAPVLQHLPLVDRVLIVPDGSAASRRADAGLFLEVKRCGFDWVLCLSRSAKLQLAFWLARVPVRLGFTPVPFPWMLTHRLDAYAYPGLHRTQFFLQAATALGVPWPSPLRLHYRVTEEESRAALHLLNGVGIDPGRHTLVALHPGTSLVLQAKRRWGIEGFVAVGEHVLRTPGRRVVLLGGPEESGLANAFARILPQGAVDWTNRLDLRQLAAVLSHCRLLVHNDSSPLHLACALGVPVLAVFGYQNHRLWGPLGTHDRVVRRDLPCSPCPPQFPCDRGFECIHDLPAAAVIEALEDMLQHAESEGRSS